MYAQQPPKSFDIPKNYSGNAFSQETPVPPSPPATEEEKQEIDASEPLAVASPEEEALPVGANRLRLGFPRLFGRSRGIEIGGEERLLIGLCLLLSQSDTKDDLLLLLLLLLLIQ